MPINWNLAGYVNPDIKITPTELPLQAMVNTGDELQKRYDIALENDTKLGIAMKNMLQNTRPEDREAAMDAYNHYENRLKERAASGKYHTMRAQTVADAGEFANLYEGLTNRKKEYDDYRQKYIEDRKDLTAEDKAVLTKMLDSRMKTVSFDKDKRFFENLSFDKKAYAGNIETVELLNSLASGWKADSGGGNSQEFKMSDGTLEIEGLGKLPQGTVVKRNSQNKWERVTKGELKNALNSALDSHQGFNQMLDRKLEQSLFTTPLQNGETIESRKNKLRSELSKGALNFAIDKNAFSSSFSQNDVNIDLPSKNGGNGSGKDDENLSVDAVPNMYSKLPVPKTLSDKGVYIDDSGVLKVNENMFTKIKQSGVLKHVPFNGVPQFINDMLLNIAEIFTPNDEVNVFNSKTLEENPGLKNKVERLKKQNDVFASAYRGKDWRTVNKILLEDVQEQMNRLESVQWHVPDVDSPKSVETMNRYENYFFGKNNLGLSQQLKVYTSDGTPTTLNDYSEKILGDNPEDKVKNTTFSGKYKNTDGKYDFGTTKFTVREKDGTVKEIFVEPTTKDKLDPRYFLGKISSASNTDSPVIFKYDYAPEVSRYLKRSKDEFRIFNNYETEKQEVQIKKDGKWVDASDVLDAMNKWVEGELK